MLAAGINQDTFAGEAGEGEGGKEEMTGDYFYCYVLLVLLPLRLERLALEFHLQNTKSLIRFKNRRTNI